MTLRPALFAVILAAVVGCHDDRPDDIAVVVYRYDAVTNCDALMGNGDTPSIDLVEAKVIDKVCDNAIPSDYKLGIGDRIDLVIDYGDVEFSEGTTVTTPTVTTTVDGATTVLNATLIPQPKITDHTFFKGSFIVPQRAHAVFELLVQASADFNRPKSLVFEIGDGDVKVTVDECADQASCSLVAGSQITARVSATGQTMQTVTLRSGIGTGDVITNMVTLNRAVDGNRIEGVQKLDVPVAPAGTSWMIVSELGPATFVHSSVIGDPGLTIATDCPAPCSLLGGDSTLAVTISSKVNKTHTVQLRQLIDNVPQTATTPIVLDEHAATSGFTKTTLVVPPTVASSTAFTLRAEYGAFQSSIATLTLVPPDVQMFIDQCPAAPCTQLSGAASVTVRATVAGKKPQKVILRSVLGGIPQTGTLGTIEANVVSGGRVSGFLTIDVPAASNNTAWRVVGELGSVSSDAPTITIVPPTIEIRIDSCVATPCELTSGVGRASVSLSVQGTKTQTLKIASRINGTTIETQDITLNQIVAGHAVATTSFNVPVAAQGSTWTLTTSLIDALGASAPVTLRPPVIGLALACGPACHPAPGAPTTVIVTAPIDLRDKSTSVIVTSSTGATTVVSSPNALSIPDNATQTVSGPLTVGIPAGANQVVQIDVIVGGFRGTTLVFTAGP